MPVKNHEEITKEHLPGLEHKTLAGSRDGLRGFEIWSQTIEVGAETPLHKHDCEEAIVVLEGEGTCMCEGEADQPLRTNETLILYPNVVHKVCNTGRGPLKLVATLSMAPVIVETPSGDQVELPWN